MNKKLLLLMTVLFCSALPLAGQNIKGRYVSKSDELGTVYHTFPCAAFERPKNGPLTFDITYRSNRDNTATINFTYLMPQMIPADSICFVSGKSRMEGIVQKIYIAPEKKAWKHRYTFSTGVKALYTFFDKSTTPRVVLYAAGEAYVYEVKPAVWKSEALVLDRIFEMIRINEAH